MDTLIDIEENTVTLVAWPVKNRCHSYPVTFSTEEQAIKFVEDRSATHAFTQHQDNPISNGWENLYELLYPTCDHGLSASLCADPINHYPA
jgi:hypothetical protein